MSFAVLLISMKLIFEKTLQIQLRFKLKAALERGGFVYVFGVKGNPGEASSQFKKDVLMQLNAE